MNDRELYVALDEGYILPNEFKVSTSRPDEYVLPVHGFVNYLKKYEERKVANREPDNLSSYEAIYSSKTETP